MESLRIKIERTLVEHGCLGIFWLGQAGFVFKTSARRVVYIDPYVSDVVERVVGFKRMMACPIAAEEIACDLVLCTHEHLDHMDIDALPVIAQSSRTRFAGPVECCHAFRKMGIPEERYYLLAAGQEISVHGIRVKGVYADHGTLAPDAIGIVLDFGGVRVYHTGDTAYRPEEFELAIEMKPDVLIPCINGRYGNMTAREAALLTRDVNPQLAIASHFGMFVEHDGDPSLFVESCSQLAPGVQAAVMTPGEGLLFRRN